MNQKVIEDYLASKGATLWGRAHDVSDPESRRDAAQWFMREMNGLLAYAKRKEAYS